MAVSEKLGKLARLDLELRDEEGGTPRSSR